MENKLVPFSAIIVTDQPKHVAMDFGSGDVTAWWIYRVVNGRLVIDEMGEGEPPAELLPPDEFAPESGMKDVTASATVTRK